MIYDSWNKLFSNLHYDLTKTAEKSFNIKCLFSDPFYGSCMDFCYSDCSKCQTKFTQVLKEKYNVSPELWFNMEEKIVKDRIIQSLTKKGFDSHVIEKLKAAKVCEAFDTNGGKDNYTVLTTGNFGPARKHRPGVRYIAVRIKPLPSECDILTVLVKSGDSLNSDFEIVWVKNKTYSNCKNEIELYRE